MNGKTLPENLHPGTNERFERLMTLMAPQAVEIPEEEQEESSPESDGDCNDTQTQTDTSEDAS